MRILEFLTPGEKLKRIRKMLGLKQYELESADVSRNFISMLESGKRGLSEDTAIKLIDTLMEYSREKGIPISLNTKYLMASPEEEARQYCIAKLSTNLKKEDILEIISYGKRYKLNDVLFEGYIKLAEELYDNSDFIGSFKNYHESLEIGLTLGMINKVAFLFNKLGKCKLKLMEFEEAAIYFRKAYFMSIENGDKSTMSNSCFNLALVLKKLNNLNDSLYFIDKYLEVCDIKCFRSEHLNALLLKSNCYLDSGDYKLALKSYEMLLSIAIDDIVLQGYIYNNLGLIYLKMNNSNTALEFFEKSEKIRSEIDPKRLSATLIDKSSVFIHEGRYPQAIELLEKGIFEAKKLNDYSYMIKGLCLLEQIYQKLDDIKSLELIYIRQIGIMKTIKQYKNEALKLYLKLIQIYLKNGMLDQAQRLIEESINL
jgi:HTH-type transcriptional regulator, quorum sensing regulator NprR